MSLRSLTFALVLAATASASAGAATFTSDSLGVEWLHDVQSPAVQTWVENQNKKTRDYLTLENGQPDPLYAALDARAKAMVPTNAPLFVETPYGKVLMKAGGLVLVDAQGTETVLAPKIVHQDGSGWSAVIEFKVSPDANKVAFSYAKNGSDMNEWQVLDLASKKLLTEKIYVRLSDCLWASDSNAVYYTEWPTLPMLGQTTRNYRALLDNGATKPELVFAPPHKEAREIYGVEDFDFGGKRYLVAYRLQGTAEIPLTVYLGEKRVAQESEFQVGEYAWRPVRIGKTDRLGKFITTEGSKIYLRSSEAGDTFGVVAIDTATKNLKTTTVVGARKNKVLLNAQRVGQNFLLQYVDRRNFHWTVEVATLAGKVVKVIKPSDLGLFDVGTLSIPITASKFGKSATFSYSEIRIPPETIKIDLEKLTAERLPLTKPLAVDSSKIKYELKWLTSKDGSRFPIEIFSRTDVKDPAYAYVYYYGYIGLTQFSMWNRKFQLALELGAPVVIVHHRGGGELGRDWQLSVKIDRLKSLEDTVTAARWLRKNLGIKKLAASGRSFGGMHTLELMAHHTDEFDAYVPVVPVSDVDEFLSRGSFGFYAPDDFGIERDNTGAPLDTPEWREKLLRWSPLANLDKMSHLPPVMLFAGDHDERVNPEQAYYAAEALNTKFPGNSMVYLYSEKNNGHNGRTEFLDEAAFLARTFGVRQVWPLF